MAEPYISVVVAARNDNHGGNMLGRMQAFLDSWMVQSQRYGLESEIVVVEWNPPPGRVPLVEELRLPKGCDRCEVRFVDVSPQLHAAIPNAAAMPLHQMIAKNTGIRRSRGEFVLATNLDIVFSPELMQFLTERRLERGVMYRMDRYDVANDLPGAEAGVDALLAHCQGHVRRVFAAEGNFGFEHGQVRALEEHDIADAGIVLGRGWMEVESQGELRYRWLASQGRVFFQRPAGAALLIDAEVGPSQGGLPLRVEVLDTAGAVVADAQLAGRSKLRLHFPITADTGVFTLRVHGRNVPLSPEPRLLHLRVSRLTWDPSASDSGDWQLQVLEAQPGTDWAKTLQAPASGARNAAWLHINACGDFTLLARDDWFRLRAYPEFPIWPVHVDALLCYAAHHAGIREKVLQDPLRMFHIEHLSGAGWTPEGEGSLHQRVQSLGVPALDFTEDVIRWIQLMRRWNAPVIFNLENWGLAGEDLPERKG